MAEKPGLISLIIPAYNEQARVEKSLAKLKAFMDNSPRVYEIILIIEKSTDKTVQLARAAAADDRRIKIITNQVHRGKGYAVRTGANQAQGDYIFYMDCDLSTDLAEIEKFIRYFQAHQQVNMILGSRAHPRSKILVPQNPLRQNLGKSFNKLVRLMAMKGVKDTQCGFKAFRSEAAKKIFELQQLDGFAFDVEVLLLARKLGYKASVLPVKWANVKNSKVNFGASLKMFRDLLWLKFKYPASKTKAEFLLETDG